MNKDFEQLRKILDGGDSFLSSGHQIIKMRTRKRNIPDWTQNDEAVKAILLRAFPKLADNDKQRMRAARWAMIIHLFYRLRYTRKQIAEELSLTPNVIHNLLRNIKRTAAGKRANGTGDRTRHASKNVHS